MKENRSLPCALMLVMLLFFSLEINGETMGGSGMPKLGIVKQGAAGIYPDVVRVERADHSLRIKSLIRKRTQSRRRYLGHVDLEFLDSAGNVLLHKRVDFSPVQWRKRQRSRWFATTIDSLPSQSVTLHVSSHKGE